jgi:hypothetical protein
VLDFTRDIQPILDRYCVECHTHENRKGGLILSGDMGREYSHAYFSLLAHRLVADGRNGLGNQPPRTIGSSASPLLKRLESRNVSTQEWRTVWMWIESGAPFAGSYGALRNGEEQRRAAEAFGRVFSQGAPVLQERCYTCHKSGQDHPEHPMAMPVSQHARRKMRDQVGHPTGQWERLIFENDPITRFGDGILVNFTRSHLSPLLLGPLAKSAGGYGSCGEVFSDTHDPDYRRLLALIQASKTQLESPPRFPLPGFKPNSQYVRELRKYGVLSNTFDLATDSLDIFAADQQYWRSLWTEK